MITESLRISKEVGDYLRNENKEEGDNSEEHIKIEDEADDRDPDPLIRLATSDGKELFFKRKFLIQSEYFRERLGEIDDSEGPRVLYMTVSYRMLEMVMRVMDYQSLACLPKSVITEEWYMLKRNLMRFKIVYNQDRAPGDCFACGWMGGSNRWHVTIDLCPECRKRV